MIDCISGARMIAGTPLGTSQDVNLCHEIPLIQQREVMLHHEAHDLIIKSWTFAGDFAWNGKYFRNCRWSISGRVRFRN